MKLKMITHLKQTEKKTKTLLTNSIKTKNKCTVNGYKILTFESIQVLKYTKRHKRNVSCL